MQHNIIENVPATTRKKLVKVTCDLCNGEIKKQRYDTDEVEIEHRAGTCYPGESEGELFTVDMCGTCFHEKLVPWLAEQGANMRKVEY